MNEENKAIKRVNLYTLGDSDVGKTCFILRYCKNSFQNNYLPTVGIDFMAKNSKLPNGEEIKVCFYDTAGQEKYRAISLNLIKTADAILLMYSITNNETFKSISNWINSIKEVKGSDFPIILIANKCDLEEERKIQKEEGEKLAESNGFQFFEVSNKTGSNVDEAVNYLVSKVIEKKNDQESERSYKSQKSHNTMKLDKNSHKAEKNNCTC